MFTSIQSYIWLENHFLRTKPGCLECSRIAEKQDVDFFVQSEEFQCWWLWSRDLVVSLWLARQASSHKVVVPYLLPTSPLPPPPIISPLFLLHYSLSGISASKFPSLYPLPHSHRYSWTILPWTSKSAEPLNVTPFHKGNCFQLMERSHPNPFIEVYSYITKFSSIVWMFDELEF